jgi:TP901 family phage tail tape measure protein
MAADATVTMRYNADTAPANHGLNSLGSTIKKVGAIMAAVFSVKAIYEIGAAFEKSFAKAGTLIDKTATDINALRKNVLELSNTTGVAATEINEGLYQALSAGVKITGDGSDALAFMTQNLKLATGGFTDTKTAIDTTTTILNAYGLEQEKVNDVSDMLIATQNEGKTTVAELGGSLSQVIPIAASLGIEYDQVGASLATLTANGDSTAEASTKMKALFNELSKSTTTTAKTFERVAGVSFPEFIKNGGTLSDVLALMQGHADDTGVGITELFSSIEAGNAAATIASASGMKKFDKSLNAIRDSSGATEKAFKEMTNTAEYKMQQAFNKMKNAGIQAFGALAPIINLVAGALAAVAAALSFVIDGFTGTNTVATIVTSAISALVIVWGALLIIQNASTIASIAHTVALKIEEAAFYATAAASYALGVGMNAALGIIGLVIIAIAALIAIAILFGKNPMAAEAKRIKKELKEMREEVDESQKQIEAEAKASEKLANELINLSKKANKTAGDIAAMRAKAQVLNKTLGEGTVEVDANTGALKLNGKEVSKNGEEILDLIAAREKEAKAQGLQDAAAKAHTLQAEAQKNMLEALKNQNILNGRQTLKTVEAYNEAAADVKYYEEQLKALAEAQQAEAEAAAKVEAELAANMTEEQKRQAIRDQIYADRELSTNEHYAALQEMMASNYAEMGLTEEEYIAQMVEHQQAIYDANVANQKAIEDATQEHLNNLLTINEEGLYNQELTHEKSLESIERNIRQQKAYNENIETLAKSKYENVTAWLKKEGVESGALAQEYADALYIIQSGGYDDIQSLTETEADEFLETYNRAMGTSYKNINKITAEKWDEVNLTSKSKLEEMETTQAEASKVAGETAAYEYGDGLDDLPDNVEDTMENVDDAIVTTGEVIADSAADAGADSTADFIAAATANMKDIEKSGRSVGISYINGILAGLEAMRGSLRSKLASIAKSMEISASVKAASSSVKVSTSIPRYASGGMVYGPTLAVVGDNPNARIDPELIAPVSKLKEILSNQLQSLVQSAIPSLNGNSTVYNNQRSVEVNATYQSQVAGNSTPGLEYLDFARQMKRALT